MDPIMRIVLPIIGAFIAAAIGSSASQPFNLLIGAALGFAIADLGILRARIDQLSSQIDALASQTPQRQEAPPTPILPAAPVH